GDKPRRAFLAHGDFSKRFSNLDHIRHVPLLVEICTTTDETRHIIGASDAGICEFAIAVAGVWRIHCRSGWPAILQPPACGAWWPTRPRPMRPWFKLATGAGFTVRRKCEDGRPPAPRERSGRQFPDRGPPTGHRSEYAAVPADLQFFHAIIRGEAIMTTW